MLELNAQMRMSEFAGIYDRVVPANHFLRQVKENIDFSFVNPMMKKSYCEAFGRPAYEPEMMFKGVFLQKLYDLSDREYIARAETDMAYKFFLGLNPEDAVPDASLLSKFRKTRLSEDMLEELIAETMRQAIEKGLVKSTSIIVDSTHSRSKHLPERPTQILRNMTKDLRREIYRTQFDLSEKFPEKPLPEDTIDEELEYTEKLVKSIGNAVLKHGSPKAKKLLERVKETLKTPNIRDIQCLHDRDARVGHKASNNKFFGYKTHVAVTENEGLVSAVCVTDGNSFDGDELPKLIDKTHNNGVDAVEVLGDMAYSSAKNLEAAEEKGVKIIAKINPGIEAFHAKKRGDYVTFNKDADTYECKNGCLAKALRYPSHLPGKMRTSYVWLHKDCKGCPYNRKCIGVTERKWTKNESYKKILWIPDRAPVLKAQKEFQETDYFKTRYKERYKIEQKTAELKNTHGLNRTSSRGLFAMKVQSYFTVFAANVKKITRLATQN